MTFTINTYSGYVEICDIICDSCGAKEADRLVMSPDDVKYMPRYLCDKCRVKEKKAL